MTDNLTTVADALQVVDANRAELLRVQGEFGYSDVSSERDAYLGALENLADAVRSHGIGGELGQLREQRAGLSPYPPMGWLALELAEGTTPVVISPAEPVGSRGRTGGYPSELVLIDPAEGRPARLAITNLKSGHTTAWDLPEGVRLAVPPF